MFRPPQVNFAAAGRALLAAFAIASVAPQAACAKVNTSCEAPPAPVADLRTSGPYQDKAGSIPDEQAQRKNAAIRAPLNDFLRQVTTLSDRYHRTRSEAARTCALAALSAWAKADALNGRVSMQGEAVRQWAAGTVALSALKLGAPQRPLPPAVQQWLIGLAGDTKSYMRERIEVLKPYGRSNLYYWSILTVGSIGLATGKQDLWTFAVREYRSVVPMIGDDGTLAAELRRKARASIYHSFAAQPLVAFAALMKSQGQPVSASEEARIDRLMGLVLAISRNPQLLAARAGAAQDKSGVPPWLPLYDYIRSGTVPDSTSRGGNVPRLGGSITELVKELDYRRTKSRR